MYSHPQSHGIGLYQESLTGFRMIKPGGLIARKSSKASLMFRQIYDTFFSCIGTGLFQSLFGVDTSVFVSI